MGKRKKKSKTPALDKARSEYLERTKGTTPAAPVPVRTTAPPLSAATPTPSRPPANEEDTTPTKNKAGLTTLFCYGTLNVHDIQREIWGEAMEGVTGVLNDYELKRWAGSAILYVERRVGERVVGKAYDLTKEQLEATDAFETDMYTRETIRIAGKEPFDVYVRNKDVSPETRVTLN